MALRHWILPLPQGGFLMPRMTNAERQAISIPAAGLQVFVTDFNDGVVMICNGSNWGLISLTTVVDSVVVNVGDTYKGGIIFYIFQSGDIGYVVGETDGLIAAVEDHSSAIQWYNGSNVTIGATASAIGTGSGNTDAIIAAQGDTKTDYTAGVARAYTGGGYPDWFLPSIDELSLMYDNIGQGNSLSLGNVGGFVDGVYWSST